MSLLDTIRSSASAEYLSHAAANSDEQSIGDYVLLYGQEDIEERNATYEVQQYMPGWFTIGDDSGGQAILMRLDGTPAVYLCGHGAIGSAEPDTLSPSFAEWIASGCPVPMDDEDDEEDFD